MLTKRMSLAGQAVVLLSAVIILTGCDIVVGGLAGREVAKDEWKRSYTLAPDGQLEIVNTNGSIDVQAADQPQVQVRAERSAGASSPEAAKDLLNQIEIREEASPTRIRIETRTPSMFGGHTKVSYFVTVPRGATLRLTNTNGQISVVGTTARVWAETTNGGVTTRQVTGAVEASTTNGGLKIEVDGVAPEGIRLQATNGGITLRLPGSAKADIQAQTVNGGISTTDLSIETSEKSRRRLEGRLNGGGPKIDIETTNGGVRIVGK
jgi:hypothetical protein